jgi:bla regulator protein BlaR1
MTAWMESVGVGVANHLWQTTAFAAAAWAVTLLLKNNQARIRYAVWLAASIKFLVPFSLLIALGGMLPKPQRAVAAPVVYATVDAVALPFSGFDATPMAAAPAPTLMERIEADIPMELAAVWLCGFMVLLTMWCARWMQVWRTLRHASQARSGREFDLLRRVEQGMGSGTGVGLRLSDNLMEPGIFGIFRPVLIWPERLSERLDDEHIEAILIHELEHARRRDNLTAALHMLVTALFWFHPLVWWMERRMIEERERACDEAVVAMGSRPGVYAESLLKAVRFCVESPLTCVAGITGADLRDRIVQIMAARACGKLTPGKKLLLLTAALLIAAVPIVLGQGRTAERIEAMASKVAPAPVQAAANAMMAAVQIPAATAAPPAQSVAGSVEPEADPCTVKPGAQFDVVSIRPSKARVGDWDSDATADEVDSSGSLRNLIEEAYGLRDFQIAGGPDWMITQTFDIKAKFGDPDKFGSEAEQRTAAKRRAQRYQSLLLDRFHFKCHMTTQELPVYDLVVARGGIKMKRAEAGESNSNSTEIQSNRQGFHALGVGVTMQGLIGAIARSAGRAIVDKTGAGGSYDFKLDWTPENRRATQDADSGVPLPELPEALEEQLGLKLVASKGPVPVMVVDHVEEPELEGAEEPIQRPAFAVSTVKPSNAATGDTSGIYTGHGRLDGRNVTLKRAIIGAYGVGPHQVIGGPDWVDTTRFDIQAKTDQDINDDSTLNAMQAALIADRFKLTMHKETRILPAYVLEVDKGGPKLEKAKGGDSDTEMQTRNGVKNSVQEALKVKNTDMDLFAAVLARKMDLPVVNETGLPGIFNFELHWTPDNARTNGDADAVSIFTAIREQLGLRLRPAKAPVEVLVIDHAELPGAN